MPRMNIGSKMACASIAERDVTEENAPCARPCFLSEMYVDMIAFADGLTKPPNPSVMQAAKNMYTFSKKARNVNATDIPIKPMRMMRKSEHFNLSCKIWEQSD